MKIKVIIERKSSSRSIQFSGKTVKELLAKLRINPETVLVAKGESILTEDEELKDKDEITLLSVVSGG